ncbi:uncharacterized protein JCM15063_006270 [Sporobolomyces koalae]|uniref:uncharacterized protein n=1 Tax=Sporobolomyces koalae TaxID=500713 RepID=UPI0031703A08
MPPLAPDQLFASRPAAPPSADSHGGTGGFEPSHQHPRPSFHRPGSTVISQHQLENVGTPDDRFLHAAEGIKLTLEERQEGYDPDLLHLEPRNTAAPPAQLDPPTQPPSVSRTVPASSLPYASRTHGEGLMEQKGSKNNLSNSLREKPRPERYPSRPSKDPAHHDRRKQGGSGTRVRGRHAVPRRKRKQLKWWQQPRTFVILLAVIVVVGVAVGLGVGLTSGRKDTRSPGNPSTNSPSGGQPSGILPSASQAPAVPGSATDSRVRPSVSLSGQNRIVNYEYAGSQATASPGIKKRHGSA